MLSDSFCSLACVLSLSPFSSLSPLLFSYASILLAPVHVLIVSSHRTAELLALNRSIPVDGRCTSPHILPTSCFPFSSQSALICSHDSSSFICCLCLCLCLYPDIMSALVTEHSLFASQSSRFVLLVLPLSRVFSSLFIFHRSYP